MCACVCVCLNTWNIFRTGKIFENIEKVKNSAKTELVVFMLFLENHPESK